MRIVPPRDPETSEFRPLSEDDDFHATHLGVLLQRWYEDSDPVAPLDAFVYCYEGGVYPPTWVMDWIGQALTRYLDEQGATSIDKLLRLKPGRGQAHPIRERERAGKTSILAHSAWIWARAYGVPTGEAAYRAVRRSESQGGNPPSPEWLEEQCRRYWFPRLDHDRLDLDYLEKFRSSPEHQRTFIESHPPDARGA